jgi:hypothetical protein
LNFNIFKQKRYETKKNLKEEEKKLNIINNKYLFCKKKKEFFRVSFYYVIIILKQNVVYKNMWVSFKIFVLHLGNNHEKNHSPDVPSRLLSGICRYRYN